MKIPDNVEVISPESWLSYGSWHYTHSHVME